MEAVTLVGLFAVIEYCNCEGEIASVGTLAGEAAPNPTPENTTVTGAPFSLCTGGLGFVLAIAITGVAS
jgi:hypothetical protein